MRLPRQRKRRGFSDVRWAHGELCYYCDTRPANTVDHFEPWSVVPDNRDENLVPACSGCNSIASDKRFDTLAEKKAYIMDRRAKRLRLEEVRCPKGCGVTYARKGVADRCPDCGELL